ncbi:hypothetical protein BKI52_43560 [marine bacterium AO1-C]|nr:hypothetical protein BKI52_43560 [marine bacterium AO1-C]
MFKSKFNNLELTQNNVLSKYQMSAIKGGGSASADCGGGKTVSCSGSLCTAVDNDGCECNNTDGTSDKKSCNGKKNEFLMA